MSNKQKGRVNETSFINLLTKREIDATHQWYKEHYNFVDTSPDKKGCVSLGEKQLSLKTIQKNKQQNKDIKTTRGLARKDGYLQVTVQLSSKERESLVKKEAGISTQKKVKTLWHQLCWRKHNEYKTIPNNYHVCHTCSVRDCGRDTHLLCAPRKVNEEHKLCRYVVVYVEELEKDIVILSCKHEPKCYPPLSSIRGTVVSDEIAKTIKEVKEEVEGEAQEEEDIEILEKPIKRRKC